MSKKSIKKSFGNFNITSDMFSKLDETSKNINKISTKQDEWVKLPIIESNDEILKGNIKNDLILAMMIKDEEKRIHISFDTLKDICNTFIILDTGSTDDTINVIREYCKKNNINLFLKEEPFVNFMTTRNVLLDYCDEVVNSLKSSKENLLNTNFRLEKYLLLLDCGDELKNPNELLHNIKQHKTSSKKNDKSAFYLTQHWWMGNSQESYLNLRLILSNSGWRYKQPVHEYLSNDKYEEDFLKRPDVYTGKWNTIILFQDRTTDDDKTARRFIRDRELLYDEYIKNPKDSRVLFYLAQTCACLQKLHDAYKYYLLRTYEQGFIEEIYHSYYRLGELSIALNHPWEESLSWFLKAYAYLQRVEPLIAITEYYLSKVKQVSEASNQEILSKNIEFYVLAYPYISAACKLNYPSNQILFVDRRSYTYKRWNLLGIVAIYNQQYKEGKNACIEAIRAENKDIDIRNLSKYLLEESYLNNHISTYKQPVYKTLYSVQMDKETYFDEKNQMVNYISTKEEAMRKALNLIYKK